jgi:hypothetical protein
MLATMLSFGKWSDGRFPRLAVVRTPTMRALWVGLKSTVRCAIGRADQAPISAIDAWQLPSPGSRPRPGASRSQARVPAAEPE